MGSKPIEEFVPGDQVLAQDESDPEAVPAIRQVEEVFENQAQVMVLGLGGREIETTPENPFWVRDKGWTAAGEIETGEELRSYDGQWIPLDSKQLTDRIDTVYNMRVAEDHTYFVGSPLWGFSVWAHNTCVNTEINNIQYYRGGNSLKIREGVDVKAVDGLIHPLNKAGKPQGLSINTNRLEPNIQRYGGAFPIKRIPSDLQILQSGRLGHFVIAPKAPMRLERYQHLLNDIELGSSNLLL